MSDSGASIRIRDPRVSKVLGWFWGIVGMGFTAAFWLAANNLYQLNLAVNNLSANNAVVAAQLADHETRIRSMERAITTLEGRNLRGGPDQGGARRGN